MTSTISSVTRRELRRIGKYDLIEAVGKGGCGSVYRAGTGHWRRRRRQGLAANMADNPSSSTGSSRSSRRPPGSNTPTSSGPSISAWTAVDATW